MDREIRELEQVVRMKRDGMLKLVEGTFDSILARLCDLGGRAERPPMVHWLKTWPEFFAGLWDGTKRAELRHNDRDFQVGDVLALQEYRVTAGDPLLADRRGGEYTGRWVVARVIRVDGIPVRHDEADRSFVLLSIEHVFRGDRFGSDARTPYPVTLADEASNRAAEQLISWAQQLHTTTTYLWSEAPKAMARKVPVNEAQAAMANAQPLAEAETPANTVPVHYVRPGGGGGYANVRVGDLAAVAMEAVLMDPPRDRRYSNNGAWDRLRKAWEVSSRAVSQPDGHADIFDRGHTGSLAEHARRDAGGPVS